MNWTKEQLEVVIKNNPSLHIHKGDLDSLPDEKGNKYHNIKTEIDGRVFDSTAEANRYCELKILKAAGIIKDFECQVSYQVAKKIKYIVDFRVWDWDGSCWVEDVKGFYTQTSRLKAKLFREKYPDIVLKIIKNGVSE